MYDLDNLDVDQFDMFDEFDTEDGVEGRAFDEDGFEGEDYEEEDAFGDLEEGDGTEADGFEGDGFADGAFGDDAFEEDGLEDDTFADAFEAELDEFGDFAFDAASGLYQPARAPLITGSAAMRAAAQLNHLVLDSMDADDADAFFRRIRRAIGGVARRVGGAVRSVARRAGGIARTVGRGLRTVGRLAGPLLQRALPMIQRVAGLAGPWGRLISGGIGAVRGLAEGRGLRGALAGALSGALPGIGGRLASAVLNFDGADEDAALDAMADMADTRRVAGWLAIPVAAGLAARMVARAGVVRGRALPSRARHQVVQQTRQAQRTVAAAARQVGGSPARRIRAMRSMGRLTSAMLRRVPPQQALRALPAATRRAAALIARRLRAQPGGGRSTPLAAARRLAARSQVLRRVPAALVRAA